MGSLPTSRESVGVYGKIPTQGDFVRINASDHAAQALDQWVQESLDAVQRAGAEFPSEPVFFLHHGPHPQLPATVGALVASQDSVGRTYPLIVFTRIDPTWLPNRFPAVPTGFGMFLLDAARILRDRSRADAALLSTWLRTLRVPGAQEFAQLDVVCRHVLDRGSVGQFQYRLFGDPRVGMQYYAFKTALDACDNTRARGARAGITLDCPLTSDMDLFVWLELARRRLYGSGLQPSFVWREGPSPRLLLGVGSAPGAMFRFLARPDDSANTLWPLTTTRADVIEQARQTMAPHHRQALETPDYPLEGLLAVLAR